MSFDPLTTNAVDLQHLLDAGKITSVKLVEEYLAQIEHHDHKFRAFTSLAPKDLLLDLASILDKERQHGRARGPLHGIPIVLKDSFMTASELGMDTTAGAWALVGAKTDTNSAIAQRLLDQGMIILGKTNMTVRVISGPCYPRSLFLPLLLREEQEYQWLTERKTGIGRNEDNDDDSGLVRSWWPDGIPICRANRRGRDASGAHSGCFVNIPCLKLSPGLGVNKENLSRTQEDRRRAPLLLWLPALPPWL